MSDFHKEAEHNGVTLLFDSCKIEKKFKKHVRGEIPYLVIRDKEEVRINSMMEQAQDLGNSFSKLKMSALGIVHIAKSYEEGIMMEAGLISIPAQGVMICPTCLSKAIFACKEQLTVLEDIERTAKEYAAKF